MPFNKLGTKLGDLNAYLADAEMYIGYLDGDVKAVSTFLEDIKGAYELSNELYTEFAKFDTKKRQEANT